MHLKAMKNGAKLSYWHFSLSCWIYNLNTWECACHNKLFALSACHNPYHQSMCRHSYVSIQAVCFPPRIWQVTKSPNDWMKAMLRAMLDNQITPLFEMENLISLSLLSPVYPHIHRNTHWNTWLIRDCCSASNIITLLPTLVSMETSFQSWLVSDRCESAQTKKGRGGEGSLCV